MPLDIESIFKATARSVWLFLVTNGQGCYIPAYQRPYSWDKDNVSRLFEDAQHGLSLLVERENTINFIGTIIAIHDTKHVTIKPVFKTEVPSRVMTIIDGQQRLCTLVMANIAFHDLLRRILQKFERKKEGHFVWIRDQGKQLLADLENTLVLDVHVGDANFRYYPRIIRAYTDVWSKKDGQAEYKSPMARLIWEYLNFSRNEKRAFRYEPKDKGKVPEAYRHLADIFLFIQREIERIAAGETEPKEFPSVLSTLQSKGFMEALWGFELPPEVKDYLTEQTEEPLFEEFTRLYRLMTFSHYVNKRMAFTVVTTESEDDAFDMFEALNTTGEPLTAFETFVPKVIDAETLQKYQTSPSRDSVARIEVYLEQFRGADKKQKAASEMLVPFALAETGTKLSKRLSDQRRYLRDEYERLSSLDDKRGFSERFAQLADFLRYSWNAEDRKGLSCAPLEPTNKAAFEDAEVAFDALVDINHQIVIAPLLRFYSEAIFEEDDDLRDKKRDDFLAAVRATAAFSMLWRGAFGGTENIDSHYRELMRSGIPSEKIPPLARRPKDSTGHVSLTSYKKALRHLLTKEGEISGKSDWVKLAAKIPVYKHSKKLARFLIFCAADDAVPDDGTPGLIKRGRTGIATMMNRERWRNGDYYTVEHIAPASRSTGWQTAIYEDPDTVHRLGNLLLLPSRENETMGNRSWVHKRLIYGALASKDDAEYQAALKQCKSNGLNLSKKANDVLTESKFLGLCKSVSTKSDQWTTKFIDQRSKRLAELAWDRLRPWLD